MDAIREYTHGQEAAVMAVLGGNDLLCCSDYQDSVPGCRAGSQRREDIREQGR